MLQDTARIKHFFNPLSFIAFLILATISTHSIARENVVWQRGYDYVSIVPIEKKSDGNNDHPVTFSTSEVYNFLENIFITEGKKEFFNIDILNFGSDENEELEANMEGYDFDHLFTKQEVQKLSRPLAMALSKASPEEDIVFRVSGRHANYIGKAALATTARVFHKNNELHIIFGEVYVDIKKKYRRKGLPSTVAEKIEDHDLEDFRLDTGTRKKPSKLPINLVSNKIMRVKSDKRDDWMIINLPAFTNEMSEQKKIAERKNNIVEDTDALQSKTQEIDDEQQLLRDKIDRLERVIEARERKNNSVTESRPVPSTPSRSLEERLGELKNIYESGVINEQQYNEKVRELLKEL